MSLALRSFLWRTLGYVLILQAGLVAAILFWPNFRDNIGTLRAMATIPVLRDMVDQLGQGGVVAYVVGQQFFKGCNTLGTAAAVLFAAGAVAGEAHRGTMEIWLARPLSRRRVLAERFAVGALSVVLPVFLTTLTIPWLLEQVDERIALGGLMLCAVHQSLSLLAIYGVTFLLSALGRNPMSIAFVMLFLTTFEFAIYLVKTVTHWSYFRLTDVQTFLRIVQSGTLEWDKALPLAAVALASFGASLWVFERRVP